MCLAVMGKRHSKRYPLAIVLNRDEFYKRTSNPAMFWNKEKTILAGKDLKEGGTWCGLTKEGRFALLTNFRDMQSYRGSCESRGLIVSNYLNSSETPENYINNLRSQDHNFYNLILGNQNELHYFSNKSGENSIIPNGIVGLSNAFLDTPWPKVDLAKTLFGTINWENTDYNTVIDECFNLLSNTDRVDDSRLPKTGLPLEHERLVSSIFISSEKYGTQSSTVILYTEEGQMFFAEKTFDKGVEVSNQLYEMNLG